jgi:complement component 1 Q subcomponent-binding protein
MKMFHNISVFFYSVVVNFNVNHTVDTDADSEPELNPKMDKPDFAELKSKPAFDVDLQLGDQTLSFSCSFLSSDSMGQSDEYSMYNCYICSENVICVIDR